MVSNTTLSAAAYSALSGITMGDLLKTAAIGFLLSVVFGGSLLAMAGPKNAPHTREVAQLPGPERPWFGWLLGNAVALQHHRDSLIHPDWAAAGATGRYLSLMALERIYTFDPAAVRYIFNKVDEFERPAEARDVLGRTMGRGSLVAVNGAQHRRERKVMDPAFSTTAIKDMVPAIHDKGAEFVSLLARFVNEDDLEQYATPIPPKPQDRVPGKRKVDVLGLMGRLTTDVIGKVFFAHDFECLTTPEGSDLMHGFDKLIDATHKIAPIFEIQNSIPLLDKIPLENRRVIDEYRNMLGTISDQVVAKRRETLNEGDDDLMALMITSETAERPDQRMTAEEVRDQMATMLFAGSTTTSVLLAGALHNIASHPEIQDRLRAEIMTIVDDRPDLDLLNTLPLLDAVIRETLRWTPPVTCTVRNATKDTVVPLQWPVKGRDGSLIESLPVKKGTAFLLSMMLLNRATGVWGPDADKFNPDRFRDPRYPLVPVPGLWGDVSSFINGPYSCIGWRLSVVEAKVALFHALRNFKFEELPSKPKIHYHSSLATRPQVVGDPGGQLPLFVSILKKD